MSAKLFTFTVSSFVLDSQVEGFLKSKGAITLDFGTSAYVNSEAMPAVLSELMSRSPAGSSNSDAMVAQLKAELGRFGADRQKIMEDNARLASQLHSQSAEMMALKDQAAGAARTIELLKMENLRLQAAAKNAAASTQAVPDEKLKQSYEKLQKDFQALRSESIDAITSLKVLEDENDDLRQEIDQLRSQIKNAATPKAA